MRIVLIVAALSVCLVLAGCPSKGAETASNSASTAKRPAGCEGYYRLEEPGQYGKKAESALPVGQVRYLGLEEGRWMMRDMMTGFGGTWVATEKGALLTVTEGPTGPTKDRTKLEVVRTAAGLWMRFPNQKQVLTFTYVAPTPPADFGMDEFLGKK